MGWSLILRYRIGWVMVGVVDLRVTMPPEADEVHHRVTAKLVTIFKRHATGPHDRVDVFAIDVEDRNRQALGKIGGEASGISVRWDWS